MLKVIQSEAKRYIQAGRSLVQSNFQLIYLLEWDRFSIPAEEPAHIHVQTGYPGPMNQIARNDLEVHYDTSAVRVYINETGAIHD
jgi:hypothetical protein